MIIDVAILCDVRVKATEITKIENYRPLKDDEALRMLRMKKVIVTPVVVGALRAVTTRFEKFTEGIGIDIRVEVLLGTTRILRLVLGC